MPRLIFPKGQPPSARSQQLFYGRTPQDQFQYESGMQRALRTARSSAGLAGQLIGNEGQQVINELNRMKLPAPMGAQPVYAGDGFPMGDAALSAAMEARRGVQPPPGMGDLGAVPDVQLQQPDLLTADPQPPQDPSRTLLPENIQTELTDLKTRLHKMGLGPSPPDAMAGPVTRIEPTPGMLTAGGGIQPSLSVGMAVPQSNPSLQAAQAAQQAAALAQQQAAAAQAQAQKGGGQEQPSQAQSGEIALPTPEQAAAQVEEIAQQQRSMPIRSMADVLSYAGHARTVNQKRILLDAARQLAEPETQGDLISGAHMRRAQRDLLKLFPDAMTEKDRANIDYIKAQTWRIRNPDPLGAELKQARIDNLRSQIANRGKRRRGGKGGGGGGGKGTGQFGSLNRKRLNEMLDDAEKRIWSVVGRRMSEVRSVKGRVNPYSSEVERFEALVSEAKKRAAVGPETIDEKMAQIRAEMRIGKGDSFLDEEEDRNKLKIAFGVEGDSLSKILDNIAKKRKQLETDSSKAEKELGKARANLAKARNNQLLNDKSLFSSEKERKRITELWRAIVSARGVRDAERKRRVLERVLSTDPMVHLENIDEMNRGQSLEDAILKVEQARRSGTQDEFLDAVEAAQEIDPTYDPGTGQ